MLDKQRKEIERIRREWRMKKKTIYFVDHRPFGQEERSSE